MSAPGMQNLNDTAPMGLLTERDFAPRVIPTHRTLWHRIVRFARLATIDFEISALEEWITDCARDGILDSNQLTGCRYRLQELRCERAAVEAS